MKTRRRMARLEKSGHLAALDSPRAIRVESGKATVKSKLPWQGVSLLQPDW